VQQIALTKLKEPVILLDEPEISLHPLFIDELTETILKNNSKLCIFVSTHSPRFVKNIIKGHDNAHLYNIKLIEKYSSVQKMKLFPQYSPASKYRVTDEHINAYFSKAILFVEGETELELFSNSYLKIMFPALKYIDVFKALSEGPALNTMHPNRVKTQTQFVSVIDMDKAIGYNLAKKKFYLKTEYFPDNKKELFLYHNKHNKAPRLLTQRKRIEAMTDKLKIHYYKPYYSTKDPNYFEYITAIREYLSYYNVYALSTTIEGTLINKNNIDFAKNFLSTKIKNPRSYNNFNNYLNGLPYTDTLNALRIAFKGKSDLLFNYDGKSGIKKNFTTNERTIISAARIGEKTSGWVSEFLDMFFLDVTSTNSLNAFEAYIKNYDYRKATKKAFSSTFEELYTLIIKVCGMINS